MRKGTKIGIAILVLFLGSLAFGISEMVKNPEQYQTGPDVDETFMDSITEEYGADCQFNMGDHQAYYDDGLQEYIGTGTFDKNGLSYEYSYRAFVQDNTVEFVKISIYDALGNQIVHKYDEDKETEYLDSLEK